MVEIDSETNQVNRLQSSKQPLPLRFFLTPERNQNLELLSHLLVSASQPVVLCGPDGVGKTVLLDALKNRLQNELSWCRLEGYAGLTSAEVEYRLDTFLQAECSLPSVKANRDHDRDFRSATVLAVDNAGAVAPGMISELVTLTKQYDNLHLLLVLNHDQWHVKSRTDTQIERCYLVEVKPLLEKECREFIQHLVSLSALPRFRKGLNDDVVTAAYRESHGLPGKLLAHFPELHKPRERRDPMRWLTAAVAGLVLLALFVQWWTAGIPKVDRESTSSTRLSFSRDYIDVGQPVLSLPLKQIEENPLVPAPSTTGEKAENPDITELPTYFGHNDRPAD